MSLAGMLAGMSSGALNYTTAGELIMTAKKMENLIVELEKLNLYYKKFDDAIAAGDTALADNFRILIVII